MPCWKITEIAATRTSANVPNHEETSFISGADASVNGVADYCSLLGDPRCVA